MLKIRLARIGKKKKPTYRFIVNESARDTYGKALEILGHYDPFSKVIEVKKDRILYWISKGAQPSPTVHNLLVDQNVIQGDKVVASKGKKKKKEGEYKSADKPAEPAVEPEVKKEEAPADKPAEDKKEEASTDESKKETKEEVKEETVEDKK